MTSSHPLLPPLPASSSSTPSAFTRFLVPSPNEHSHTYHPKDTGSLVTKTTMIGAGVGTLVSCVQNALDKHDKGAMGIFTRSGGSIAYFTAIGFMFSTVSAVTANVRQTDDFVNGAAGGCAAGFIAGVRAKSLPVAFGGCALMGTLIGTFEAAGGSLTGADKPTPIVEQEDKTQWYTARRASGLKAEAGLA